MGRKLVMAVMLMTFLSAATVVFAEDVFITRNGSKYHNEICRLLKNKENVKKMDKKEAIEKEYTPCKRCFNEDVIPEGQAVEKKK